MAEKKYLDQEGLTYLASKIAKKDLSNVDNAVFLSKLEEAGGGGGLEAVVLTTEEYEALTEKDPNVLYLINDDPTADEIMGHVGDTDNPHKVTAEQVGALTTYTSLAEIGLSGEVTMEQVCVALPDCSMLLIGNTVEDASGNYISDTPSNLGTVQVIRYSVARIFAQFVKADETSVNYFVGKYHSSHGWTGWEDITGVVTKPLKPPFIEMTPTTDATNGGYIDFHYAGSTDDYTSRIIEGTEGRLTVEASDGFVVSHNLRVNKEIRIPDLTYSEKGARIYSSDGIGLSFLDDSTDTNSARTGIKINVPSADLATLVRVFHTTEAGDAKWYNLYGEHNKPTPAAIGAQKQHYFYEPADFGCSESSTPTEIWNAMPDHSVFIYPSTSLTSEEWNFPTDLGVVRVEKYAVNRGFIEYFSKVETTKDYRMYLDNNTGYPSGVWHSYYTTANKPTPADIGAAPAYTYGTTDLTAGTSTLETGKLHFVYE